MASTPQYGFATKSGVDWSKYAQHRPLYPASFFERLFAYHSRKSGVLWSLAHDVGAGAGIVSGHLAQRFTKTLVSDPNASYLPVARESLITNSGFPESKFDFLPVGAESSGLESGTVDLIAACECIHWTDPVAALKEFHRQLKPGGSLFVSYYARPLIIGNERASKAWEKIFLEIYGRERNEVNDRAFRTSDTGLTCLDFEEEKWEGVERVFVNAKGDLGAFNLTLREIGKEENKVKDGEKIEWVEDDEGWSEVKGIEWFKAYIATWVPRVPEEDIEEIWEEMEEALGGEETEIQTPVAMVFATKR